MPGKRQPHAGRVDIDSPGAGVVDEDGLAEPQPGGDRLALLPGGHRVAVKARWPHLGPGQSEPASSSLAGRVLPRDVLVVGDPVVTVPTVAVAGHPAREVADRRSGASQPLMCSKIRRVTTREADDAERFGGPAQMPETGR